MWLPLLLGALPHVCTGSWGVAVRALRQKATVLKWLSLRRSRPWLGLLWEQWSEAMSRLTHATCLSTTLRGVVLMVETSVEIGSGEYNENDLEMVTRQRI